jgi:hypothetical protein
VVFFSAASQTRENSLLNGFVGGFGH